MNVDWDEAPQGAEAGHPGSEGLYPAWFRKDAAGLVEHICPAAGVNVWTGIGDFEEFPVGSVLRPPILIGHAPLASQWNGEGLPPVGTVCEYNVGGGGWFRCEIRYVTRPYQDCPVEVVMFPPHLGGEQTGVVGTGPGEASFRPIRTPEQIAAEERLNKAMDLYGAVMNHSGKSFKSLPVERQEHYLSLIDNGWQRVDRA